MSKTILFIYPTPFNPIVGGIERVTDLLAKGFIRRGYKVIYLHHVHKDDLMDYDYPAPVYFFPSSNYHSQENVIFYHKFLADHKVEFVINQCGLFEDSILYLNIGNNKCKTISVLHSNPMLNYEHLSSEELILKKNTLIGFLRLMVRVLRYHKIKRNYLNSRITHFEYLFAHSDNVTLLSSSHKEILDKYGINYDGDKINIIPNPFSFAVQDCLKKKQLLYVGRLEQGEKRPDRLLMIWKQLYRRFPNWEMIIVGDGKERRRLENQAKKYERISFVGFQSPEKYYREASIFCLTSNLEGFPMVLPEAMAFGVVPFSFNSFPAVTDIISDGKTGFLIEPFSIKEYANKLALLMNNENVRIQMSKNCMKFVTRFSLDNIVPQWEDLFYSLIN